jgi:hypothetical protein
MNRLRLLALTLTLGACVTAGSSAAASTPLAGVYQATIKGSAPQLNGVWLISFAPNGAYAVVKKPSTTKLLIGGLSTVSGHSLAMHDETGPLACIGSQARATYSWALSGKKLRLMIVKDKCAGRAAVLASAPYTKVR